jgi:hypothetical protein
MPEPDDKDRRPGARPRRTVVHWTLATATLLLGVALVVSGQAPGLAWPLAICGIGLVSILISQQPDQVRRR